MKKNTKSVDISIDLKYTNKEQLTVADIVDALESAEKLLYRTRPFIEAAGKDYELLDMKVYVENVSSGSLWETLKATLIYGGVEKQEKAEKAFGEFFENTNMKSVILMGVGAAAGAGLMLAYPSDKASTHIEAYNSQIVNFGDNTGLDKEEIESILDSMPNKAQLARDATKFISPAKGDVDANIEIGAKEITPIVINSKVIAEAPEKYEPPKPEKKTETYQNITIIVMALDADNPNKWQGIIKDVVDTRVKLVFSEEIDISKLSRTKIKANVEVISKYNKSKSQYKPSEIYIDALLD